MAEADLLGGSSAVAAARPAGGSARAAARAATAPARADAELGVEDASRRSNWASAAARSPRSTWASDQRDVGRLVGRVGGEQLGPPAGGAQQLAVEVGEVLAAVLGPRLVAVVGQQLAARNRARAAFDLGARVERGRAAVSKSATSTSTSVPGSSCNVSPVDTIASGPRARRAKCAALCRRGRGVGDGGVGPQRVDHLLAVEPPVGGQREQLDEVAAGRRRQCEGSTGGRRRSPRTRRAG